MSRCGLHKQLFQWFFNKRSAMPVRQSAYRSCRSFILRSAKSERSAVQSFYFRDFILRQFNELVLPCALGKSPAVLPEKAKQIVECMLRHIEHIFNTCA